MVQEVEQDDDKRNEWDGIKEKVHKNKDNDKKIGHEAQELICIWWRGRG